LEWYLFPGLAWDTAHLREDLYLDTPGSLTFTSPPLPAGDYSFFHRDMEGITIYPVTADYTFTLNVSAVPEPASLGLLALATVLAPPTRRRPRVHFVHECRPL
jgi:hypothetical protein